MFEIIIAVNILKTVSQIKLLKELHANMNDK
jgi:hypothetical protein